MVTLNPFDLLGDDDADSDEPSLLMLLSSPSNKTLTPPHRQTDKPSERLPYGGAARGRRGRGTSNYGHRRVFQRRSGTGRGNEFKREGAGRGNWGTLTDIEPPLSSEELDATAKTFSHDNPSGQEHVPADSNKDKQPQDKEMTLEEYEKVVEEKRKALQTLKTEERKVDIKVFESMLQLSTKKNNDDIFVKLGFGKDKRKEALEKEDRSKKSVNINEFLKPVKGESYYNPGRRERGARGGNGGYATGSVPAPSIEDLGQFPTLVAN